MGTSPDKLFIVPGNHDVERKQTESVISRAIHKQFRESPNLTDDLLADTEAMKSIWPKLKAFSDFSLPFGAPKLSPENPCWSVEIQTTMGTASIVGLNSAILCLDGTDSSKNLALGFAQVEKVVHSLPADRLMFILMHHPPSWMHDGKTLEKIIQNRPHILFCGHIHDQGGLIESPLYGSGLLRLVAGAGHGNENKPPEHGYAWGCLSSNGLDYYPRIWAPKTYSFTGNRNDFQDMDANGKVRITCDRLPLALNSWIPNPEPIVFAGKMDFVKNPKGHWCIKIEGDIKDFGEDRQKQITDKIQELSKDVNVRLRLVSEGSVYLVFEGSQAGYIELSRLFEENPTAFSEALGESVIELDQTKGATIHTSSIPNINNTEDPEQFEDGLLFPSKPFKPPVLIGILFDLDNDRLTCIISPGDASTSPAVTETLLDYLHSALTIKEKNLWVNLSEYESNRMIPDELVSTKFGDEMLNADCLLKRLTSTFLHPETNLGKEYWSQVFTRISKELGLSSIPVKSFFKVTILPKAAGLHIPDGSDPSSNLAIKNYNHYGPSVFVSHAEYKIECEIDQTAVQVNADQYSMSISTKTQEKIDQISLSVFRSLIAPEIENEINNGKNFAKFRQLSNCTILANWCKENLPHSDGKKWAFDNGPKELGKFRFAGDNQIQKDEPTQEQKMKQLQSRYYDQYLNLFRKGVFRVTDQLYDSDTNEILNRSFVAGCICLHNGQVIPYRHIYNIVKTLNKAQIVSVKFTQCRTD